MSSLLIAVVSAMGAVLMLGAGASSRLRSLGEKQVGAGIPSAGPIALPAWRWRRLDCRLDIVRLADAWAGEVGAGQPAATALVRALAMGPEPLRAAARRIETGVNPAVALTDLAALRGAQGARSLAGCWVIASTGGALASTIERTGDALRDELALRAEVRAQVAAPRATARMLAGLPLLGPLLGALVGANTVAVLVSTSAGRVLLVGGLTLNALGWWWVRKLVRSAERAAW